MIYYINYEVEFDEEVDWNDAHVKHCLEPFNCQFLYLRNLSVMTVIFSVPASRDIYDVLSVIYDLYITDMHYREYGAPAFIKYKQ
jgi:hypothetical protein